MTFAELQEKWSQVRAAVQSIRRGRYGAGIDHREILEAAARQFGFSMPSSEDSMPSSEDSMSSSEE